MCWVAEGEDRVQGEYVKGSWFPSNVGWTGGWDTTRRHKKWGILEMGWADLQLSNSGWKRWSESEEWNDSRSSKSRKVLLLHQNENRYFSFLSLPTLVGIPLWWLSWGPLLAMLFHCHPTALLPWAASPRAKWDGGGLALWAPCARSGNWGYSPRVWGFATVPSFWWGTRLDHRSDSPAHLPKPRSRKCRHSAAAAGSFCLEGWWTCGDLRKEDFGGLQWSEQLKISRYVLREWKRAGEGRMLSLCERD